MVVRMNEENQKKNPFPLSNFGSGCANNNDNGEDDDQVINRASGQWKNLSFRDGGEGDDTVLMDL